MTFTLAELNEMAEGLEYLANECHEAAAFHSRAAAGSWHAESARQVTNRGEHATALARRIRAHLKECTGSAWPQGADLIPDEVPA